MDRHANERDKLARSARLETPPAPSQLATCPVCGRTVVRALWGFYDPSMGQRLAIWRAYGNQHVFSPEPRPWSEGHHCVPSEAPHVTDQ